MVDVAETFPLKCCGGKRAISSDDVKTEKELVAAFGWKHVADDVIQNLCWREHEESWRERGNTTHHSPPSTSKKPAIYNSCPFTVTLAKPSRNLE
jgi:hypothetical protein